MIWKVGQRVKLVKVRKKQAEKYIGGVGFIREIGPFAQNHCFENGTRTRLGSDCTVGLGR